MNEHQPIERQLFDWSGWDENGPMDLQFYNVVLKVPIGEFPVGTKFDCAFLSGETSTLQLYEEDGSYHEFELKLSVGDKIASKE